MHDDERLISGQFEEERIEKNQKEQVKSGKIYRMNHQNLVSQ